MTARLQDLAQSVVSDILHHMEKGFTLVELMVVLAILGIALAATAPLSRLYSNDSNISHINEFVASARFARNQAITSNSAVVLCQVDTSALLPESVPECSGGTNWESGWVIFTDTDGDGTIGNGTPDLTDDDPVLRLQLTLPNNHTLRSGRSRVVYPPTGIIPGQNNTWTLCDASRSTRMARAAIIAVSGRVRLAEDGPDADNIRDIDGVNLECPA